MLQVLAAALAIAAAALAHNASAHPDTCATGESAVVGTTTCVSDFDLEFRDWCQNLEGIVTDNGRCRIPYDDTPPVTPVEMTCEPFRYAGFIADEQAGDRSECENQGQTACAAAQVYSAAAHSCASCPADNPLAENGVCVFVCSGGNLEENGACVASCSTGNVVSPGGTHCMSEAEARAARTCGDRNYEDAARKCNIPVSPADGQTSVGCYLGGSGAPQCADVFGADLNIPAPNHITGEYGSFDNGFVYNCGNGANPRTTNPRHTRACSCDAGSGFSGNFPMCGCLPGRIINADGDACASCPEGQAESNGVCVEECPPGQAAVDGICDAECPEEGQRRVHSSDFQGVSGCFPLAEARALAECESAGWPARDVGQTNTLPHQGQLRCGIPSDLHGDGRNEGTCLLYNNGATLVDDDRPCLTIYGDPPVYPRAEEHPDVADSQ